MLVLCACLAAIVGMVPPAYADSVREQQWHLGFLGLRAAAALSTGEGVIVGVVDSGVDANHPDLVGSVLPGLNVETMSPETSDHDGHGTAMAGLIVGHGHGAANGVLGIAPKARVLPVKTGNFGVNANGTEPEAITWAIGHGAKVLCLAFGGTGDDELRESIEAAQRANVVVVAAAGNAPGTRVERPAGYPGVVAAAAVGRDGSHASVSVTGPEVVLAAPGVDIVSTYKDGGYGIGTGTSDATAIIAGVAALVRSRYPHLSATEVIHRMTATATDKGPPGRDDEYGYGIVNPLAALTASVPPLTPSASPSASPFSTDTSAQALPPAGRGISPWLVVVAIMLLLIGAVATWMLIQDRAREKAEIDRSG